METLLQQVPWLGKLPQGPSPKWSRWVCLCLDLLCAALPAHTYDNSETLPEELKPHVNAKSYTPFMNF